ncbi:MAG: hypothetical protein ABIK28_17105 [Planctomycetota bacterium]
MKDRVILRIPVRNPFHLRLMVLSHGWVDLLPYRWDQESRCLHAVVRTYNDRAFALTIKSEDDNRPGQKLAVIKTAGPRISNADLLRLETRLRWCFRLDDDFLPFQQRCAGTPGLEWVREYGLGPFLRNAEPFEEFTKVLMTTNINWGGTKSLNHYLIQHLGNPVSPRKKGGIEGYAYPTAEKVAAQSERFLREKIRLGYRAPYLKELAGAFVKNQIDFQSFLDPGLPLQDLSKALKKIKGFGPYAVNTVLMTLGRYEDLILDSWIRKRVSLRHFKGKNVSDAAIRKIYAPWERWAGLACWFECAYDTWLKNDLENNSPGPVHT